MGNINVGGLVGAAVGIAIIDRVIRGPRRRIIKKYKKKRRCK